MKWIVDFLQDLTSQVTLSAPEAYWLQECRNTNLKSDQLSDLATIVKIPSEIKSMSGEITVVGLHIKGSSKESDYSHPLSELVRPITTVN